ncbi:helix-turn-helix transcriptional regulator [Streptomyces chlorus]|uniref:Helix-turn-helix transcriptional regulator n=1 Tax=Streptomyces chlorus TaxID=887452 RepID=A0ABW1E9Q8_9ACTN
MPGADRVLLLRIKTFIRWHLSDSGLTPQAIADAHSISVRYLHRLFKAEGTSVCQWIRELRLHECRRELAVRPPGSVGLGQVARRWGFTSPARFSRAFRRSYGLSPTDWLDRKRAVRAAGEMPRSGSPAARGAHRAGAPAPRRGPWLRTGPPRRARGRGSRIPRRW